MSEIRPAAQPAVEDFFALFGIEPVFTLDATELAGRYRDLQRSVHPDRFAGASGRDRLLAVQKASIINEAYQTLRDPLRRACYLLERQGFDPGLENNTVMDSGFLMDQLELREGLEEARDAERPAEAVARVAGDIDARIDALRSELERLFDSGTGEALQAACEAVRRLQFMERLHQQATDLEEELLEL